MNEDSKHERLGSIVAVASFIGTLLLCLLGSYLLPACVGTRLDPIIDKWKQVSADGNITATEAREFADTLANSERTNWPVAVGSVIASLAATFLGVRTARNGTARAIEELHERIDAREEVRPIGDPLKGRRVRRIKH